MSKTNDELIQDRIDNANKDFRKNGESMIAEIDDLQTMVVSIVIEWGDWKHEHGYADYIMQQHGFKKIKEDVTEEDGSDCYSSIHYYK